MMGSEDIMWMDQLQDKKGKKRFNEEQIRSLESMFESQTKLDPRKKQQLAAELGLQPRQIGIWFQNKRARWKSKQLESQYGALKADYDALLCSFESLKKEKQILAKELQILTELLGEPLERREYGNSKNEGEENHRPSLLVPENLHSHDNGTAFSNFSELEEELFMGQTASDLSTSAEQQFCIQPSWPSNQSCNISQWWELVYE